MIRSAITISLVPEARGGPFVLWDGLEAGCRVAADLGFDGVELFARSAGELDLPALRKLLKAHGLQLAAIGTGAGWVVHRLRFTEPDAGLRRQATEFATRILEAAAEFGAPAIIGSMQGRSGDGLERPRAEQCLAEALGQLADRAGQLGVPLLFEPLNRYETNLFNRTADVLDFLDRCGIRNVNVLCDLFHMNIEEPDIAAALRAAGGRLGHVHFADSNRQAIGFGHTDMPPIAGALRELNYQGFLSAEVFPGPDPESAARQTIHAFRALFPRSQPE